MAQFVNMFEVDLDKRSYPVNLNQTVSEGNVSSNRIGAYVYKDGAAVNLGGNCTGMVMRADGSTVPLTGVIDGNAAYVVLDQPSCAIPGPIQVAVNWVSGSNTTTLLVAYGTVIQTNTRDYVQPGTPIPDINTLLAAIEDMEEATAAAEAAATMSVRYDTTQSLTDAQKGTARRNIEAISGDDYDLPPIELLPNRYIDLSSTSVAMTDGVPQYASGTSAYSGGYMACEPGDYFTVSGTGGNSTRLWAFCNSTGVLLQKSLTQATESGRILIAPPGAAFIIVHTNDESVSYKGVAFGRAVKEQKTSGPNVFDLNYFNPNANNTTSFTTTKTGVIVASSSSAAFQAIAVKMRLKPATKYTFSVKKHTTSGVGFINLFESSDGGATYPTSDPPTAYLMTGAYPDDIVRKTSFTTTTGDVYIRFYCTASDAEIGNVEYSDIMLQVGNGSDTYTPFSYIHDDSAYSRIGYIENDIAAVKSLVTEPEYDIVHGSDIIQGSYNRSGDVVASNKRIRLEKFVPVTVGDEIIFSPGAKANGMLVGIVNRMQDTKESEWYNAQTVYKVPLSGRLMLLFRNMSGESQLNIAPGDFDANVIIRHVAPYVAGSERYNGRVFRFTYLDGVPYPERNSSTYSVTYAQIIAKYDELVTRCNNAYNDTSSLVPRPLTITKTSLITTDSGYTIYEYDFTPAYPKKTAYLIAGTHGNEYESIYGLLNMMTAIYAEQYNYPQLRDLRENVKIVIIPLVNPYGFEHNTKMNGDGENIFDYYTASPENQPKEMTAIKTAFSNANPDYFMDMHTDPYNSTSTKNCYGYAYVESSTFPVLYNLSILYREIIFNEFNSETSFISDDKDIVVGRIPSLSSTGSTAYGERQGVPSNLIEIGTGFGAGGSGESGAVSPYPAFAEYGSPDMVRIASEWYMNVLLEMYKNLLD